MARKKAKPLGAEPFPLWWARWTRNGDWPPLMALLVRYKEVMDAVQRYQGAKLDVPAEWIWELGTCPHGWPRLAG